MNINYAISPYPSLLEAMVAKIYEASSPDAEVQSFTIVERDGSGTPSVGAGHQVPVTVSFNGVDMVTHIVRLFTASATLLHEYDVQPTKDVVTIFDPIYFRVGDGGANTPAAGQSMLVNAVFSGLTAAQISVNQEGLGFLLPAIDYSLTGNTVSLIGAHFETGQRWYIFKKPQVVTNIVNDSVVGKGFGGFVDVTSNISYIPGHLRKLVRFSGTGNYTFAADAAVPIGYNHTFINYGTNPSTPQITFSNGTLLYNGSPKSFLSMPFGSNCTVTWDGTHWNFVASNVAAAVAVAPAAGDIVGQGNFNIGDVPGGDTSYTITHGLGLAYAYKIFGTIRSNNVNHARDNTIGWAAFDLLTNSFTITMQEIFGEGQDVSFDWIIVKA